MTRDQIERIAENCGVKVSYVEAGHGGFIVDETRNLYKSLNDMFMETFIVDKSRKMYSPFDENTFLAA